MKETMKNKRYFLITLIVAATLLIGCTQPPVVGGQCEYDKFKGKCEIISVLNENDIKFSFTPDSPLDLKNVGWVKDPEEITDKEYEEYAGYIGLKCLNNKYPITNDDLNKCGIKENAVFNCEIALETKGTCTPTVFTFYK